jgi:RNA polymerase sigma factor (sigma-70 family)
MDPSSTIALVRKAKEGDLRARGQLIDRFYQDWVDRFHGNLGRTIRRLYDTQDLVQSALADALKGLPRLRHEGVFFTWVTSIIRHKISARKRRLGREVVLGGRSSVEGLVPDPAAPQAPSPADRESDETYLKTLEAIIALFPKHGEEMASLVLGLLDGRPVREVAKALGVSERTAFRRIREGIDLLKKKVR